MPGPNQSRPEPNQTRDPRMSREPPEPAPGPHAPLFSDVLDIIVDPLGPFFHNDQVHQSEHWVEVFESLERLMLPAPFLPPLPRNFPDQREPDA